MSSNLAGLPQRYLRTPEAARFVGLSIRTLEKHRIYGTGPRYSKLGGRVVYRVDDLQAWVDRGAKASTSDPGVGTVLPAKRHSPDIPAPSARRAAERRLALRCTIGPAKSASSSNSSGLSPVIWRPEMRRTSWPIRSSAWPRPIERRRSIFG
jgi:predicted DNA-binding transcriptional regulator AlpA